MSAPVTKCPHCGARPRSVGKYCEFCGSLLPVVADASVSPAVESNERRFERLENHASFPDLLKKRPSAGGMIAKGVVGTIFTGVFLVMAIVIASVFGGFAWLTTQVTPFGGFLMVIPLFIVGVGIFAFVRMSLKTGQLATAEMVVQSAIVAGERTQVSGGGDSSSHSSYFITLESRDGKRTEFAASDKLAGRVTEGDIGVAYIKSDQLIDFERVRV